MILILTEINDNWSKTYAEFKEHDRREQWLITIKIDIKIQNLFNKNIEMIENTELLRAYKGGVI